MARGGWQNLLWQAWFPLLVFSPFIIDASVTLLKRFLCGEKITEPHRKHYYQRLIIMGWGHRKVALLEYALMLGVGISALLVLNKPFPGPILLVWSAIYACLMVLLDMKWKAFKRGAHD